MRFARCNQKMTCRNRPNLSWCDRVKTPSFIRQTVRDEETNSDWIQSHWGSAAVAVNLTCIQAKRRYRLPPQEPQSTTAEKTPSISKARLIHRCLQAKRTLFNLWIFRKVIKSITQGLFRGKACEQVGREIHFEYNFKKYKY